MTTLSSTETTSTQHHPNELKNNFKKNINNKKSSSSSSKLSKNLLPELEDKFSRNALPAFPLKDGLTFIALGTKAIAQDEFSRCFQPLPRTKFSHKLLRNPRYILGFFYRYACLFPYRVVRLILASICFFTFLPLVLFFKNDYWQKKIFQYYCNAFLDAFGSRIKYHGNKPKLSKPHIFVSNHTSVIDYIVLSGYQFPHAAVGQKHGGLIGYFENSILALNGSLMFQRKERKDRMLIAQKMKSHVENTSKVPLLVFPEGCCVNNEYTVMFQKGAFDMNAIVVPVAIKYDKSWADAYWSSKTQTFTQHLLYLMTRWALKADVWFLQPQQKNPTESAVDFANRIKNMISKKAGLKNLSWNGHFKNFAPEQDKKIQMQANPQFRYGAVLRSRTMHDDAYTLRPFRGHALKRSKTFGCLYDLKQASSSFSSASTSLMFHNDSILPILRSSSPAKFNKHSKISQSSGISSGKHPNSQNNAQSHPDSYSQVDVHARTPSHHHCHHVTSTTDDSMTVCKNEILVHELMMEEEDEFSLIHALSDTKKDLVNTWKEYTKLKQSRVQRRVEYASWRQWFKKRLAFVKEKAEREVAERERSFLAKLRKQKSNHHHSSSSSLYYQKHHHRRNSHSKHHQPFFLLYSQNEELENLSLDQIDNGNAETCSPILTNHGSDGYLSAPELDDSIHQDEDMNPTMTKVSSFLSLASSILTS